MISQRKNRIRRKVRKEQFRKSLTRRIVHRRMTSTLRMLFIDFAAQVLYTALAWHKSPHQPTSLFMKSPFQLRCYNLSSKLIPFSCLSRLGITMRVRRPLKGTLRMKIRSSATQSKKVKETRKPNCFFCSSARKKLNQSRKGYQNMRQSQRRRQNQKRS